jgi:inward rectifier potassium channel
MQEQTAEKIYRATVTKQSEYQDLGFGSVVARESRQRLLNQDGSFNIHRKGLSDVALRNIYHWLLTMPWWEFLGFVIFLYLGINLVFAVLFLLCGESALADGAAVPMQNLFLRAFFFSVQTFGTIGYGVISPIGAAANFLVTAESIVSILLQALVTGMFFARFSRPSAQVKFSKTSVVAPYQNGKALMFRLVNMRASQLIEVSAQVSLVRFVVEDDGKIARRFEPLSLERQKVSFFPLAWTVVHPIGEESPLYNLSIEDLKKFDAEILILLTAIDEDFAQTVHTRTSYKPEEIIWDAKFVSMYNKMGADEPVSIDVKKLSQVEKV